MIALTGDHVFTTIEYVSQTDSETVQNTFHFHLHFFHRHTTVQTL